MHNALKPKRRLKFTPIDEKWQVAPSRFPEPTVVCLDVISLPHVCGTVACPTTVRALESTWSTPSDALYSRGSLLHCRKLTATLASRGIRRWASCTSKSSADRSARRGHTSCVGVKPLLRIGAAGASAAPRADFCADRRRRRQRVSDGHSSHSYARVGARGVGNCRVRLPDSESFDGSLSFSV